MLASCRMEVLSRSCGHIDSPETDVLIELPGLHTQRGSEKQASSSCIELSIARLLSEAEAGVEFARDVASRERLMGVAVVTKYSAQRHDKGLRLTHDYIRLTLPRPHKPKAQAPKGGYMRRSFALAVLCCLCLPI